MTTDQYKAIKPEHKHLEGDELWNAMEDYMIRQKEGEEILRAIIPFWKRYTLRWLFYRKTPNFMISPGWQSPARCKACKKGSNHKFAILDMSEGGGFVSYCPKCNEKWEEEPNRNLNYLLYIRWSKLCKMFWNFLSYIRLIRSSIHGRYNMFGDESRYVKMFTLYLDGRKSGHKLKKRPWWQYVFIERPKLNI